MYLYLHNCNVITQNNTMKAKACLYLLLNKQHKYIAEVPSGFRTGYAQLMYMVALLYFISFFVQSCVSPFHFRLFIGLHQFGEFKLN